MGSPGRAPRPYTRGWTAPWRGQWGDLGDGHTKLARRAKGHLRAIREEYPITTPLGHYRAKLAAELLALVDMTRATMGTDPKSTRRALTALVKTADAQLQALHALGPGNGRKAPSLSTYLASRYGTPTPASASGTSQ